MPRTYTAAIDGDEYIGESLEKINGNFQVLDDQQQSLSAVIASIRLESNIALELVTAALTGVRDINIRLNDKGVTYSPHAFYVSSLSGSDDSKDGSIVYPYLTIDKAINEISNVAKSSPRDPSNINKINSFYIFLKDAGTYALSSAVTLANIPGTVHIVGQTVGDTISAGLLKPSNTFHTPFVPEETISNFAFETTLGEANLRDYTSFKVYQTFGKNVIPLPGYVTCIEGTKSVYGFNNALKRALSAKLELENVQNDRFYDYVIIGNEIKQIESVTNDNYFEVTTNFASTVSGLPLFLANKNNWYYAQTDPYQTLTTPGDPNLYSSFNTTVVSANIGSPLFTPGQTKFETANILHFNGNASFVVKAFPLSAEENDYTGRMHLDDLGTLFTDRLSSKTQLPPTDVTVQGVVNFVPFFEKTFYELYRGVYDRIDYDTTTVQATAGNYERSTVNTYYNRLLNTVKIPRTNSIRMPFISGLTYIQPLPTTIFFTNTASAGFKLIGTSLHLKNVYVRGPRVRTNTTDIVDTRNIGVQATNNSVAAIDSDCAIANFSIGLHAANNSTIITGEISPEPIHEQNALTVTDNSVGAIIENGSTLQAPGSRLVIAQNYQDGLVVQNGSNSHLQFVDIFHNGGTGIISKNNSNVSIGNVCLIGNRYGINCSHSSNIVISPKLLKTYIEEQPYIYYSPNFIYCNGVLDIDATAIQVSQNSNIVLEETNLVKNSLSGTTLKIEDTSTGYLDSTTIFGTRNNSSANRRYSVGISTSNNSLTLKNTSIFNTQTAIKVNPNASLALENIFISRAGVGLGLTDNTRVDITFTNYPSSNNVINSTDRAIYIDGSQNTVTSFAECTNFRLSSVVTMGLNNYCAVYADTVLKPMIDNFIFPQDARNALNNRDNKVRTATYPRTFPRSGALPPFMVTY